MLPSSDAMPHDGFIWSFSDVCVLHILSSLVVQHCCWLFIVRVCHCPSSVSTVWLSCYQWLWFWSGVVCSWTVAVISGFVVGWCVVIGVGSIIGVVVVVVVEEMLCANSKVRLLACDDLTWNNNWSYAIPHDIVWNFCQSGWTMNSPQNNKMKPKKVPVIDGQCGWREIFLIFLLLCSTLLDIYFVWTVFLQLEKHQICILTITF